MKKKNRQILGWSIGIILGIALLGTYLFYIQNNNQGDTFSAINVAGTSGSSAGTILSNTNQKPLAVVECIPEFGYDYCDENTYGSNEASSTIRFQHSMIQGLHKGDYYVGSTYINVKSSGRLYSYKDVYDSTTLMNSVSGCGKSGCQGTEISATSKFVITNGAGQSYTSCPSFIAYSFAGDPNGNWAWSTLGWGWFTKIGCPNIKQVGCYDDTDCSSAQYCDKSSGWQYWACKQKTCNTGDVKCVGTDSYSCGGSNFNWVNNGKVAGKCGIECTTNANCANKNNQTLGCYNGNINTIVSNGTCVSNICQVSNSYTVQKSCFLGCSANEGTCFESTTGFRNLLIGLGFVIVIAFIIIYLIVIRRKHSRK
jgi:hypothetical protein